MKDASADDIAQCCLTQYEQLPAKGTKPAIRSDGKFEWTILAGVVMELEGVLHCLSLCTGVKALPYVAISAHGDLLHDCHAEVLARRGARTWLLKRLMSEVKAGKGPAKVEGMQMIFQRLGDRRWSLHSNVKLHLYCSTFPCGDASSSLLLQFGDLNCQQHDFAERQPNGEVILRGRTALSDRRPRLRTKPGKLQSMPSISMSCTDKMAMWSAIGIQGSLLSRWLEPIFFDGLIVGVDSMREATHGAVNEAVQDCQKLLHSKLGQGQVPTSRPLKVASTALTFPQSKERVQAMLLAINPEARTSGPSNELDHVPSAASIVWIRGEKKEQIILGRKEGVAMPKDKTIALTSSTRSRLSKAGFYALVREAEACLGYDGLSDGKATYYQSKHIQSNAGQACYRMNKDHLRGSLTSSAQQEMVTLFLTGKGVSTFEDNGSALTVDTNSTCSPPFHGWLVSGEKLESFY